jgi:hypothetical protein
LIVVGPAAEGTVDVVAVVEGFVLPHAASMKINIAATAVLVTG